MKKRKSFYPGWLSAPALIIYTLFAIVPIAMSLYLSFTDWNIKRWDSPVFVGLKSYLEIIGDPVFLKSLLNSVIFAVGTTVLKVAFGLILALALNKPFRGNNIFRTIFYLPCVLSITVIGLLFTAILSKNGLLNNILGFLNLDFLQTNWLGHYGWAMFWVIFIESWMWAGFNMFVFISGLQAISRDYYEAASTEGATPFQKFVNITLPLLMPAITVNATLDISGGMRVFDIIYVLTKGGPGADTQVLSTYAYQAFTVGYLGESCAANVILTVLVAVVAFSLNHYFKRREVEI